MIIFILYVFIGITFAIILIKKGTWFLFFGGLVLALYGGLVAEDAVYFSSLINNSGLRYAGNSLLLFFSILGSTLVGISLSEIRKKHYESLKND